MKKICSILLLIFGCINMAFSLPTDTIHTIYKNGEFISQYQKLIKVSSSIATSISDDLVSDFHSRPGNLFNWALKDLGLQSNKKDNEVIIVFKSSTINNKTGITEGIFDIVVPGFTTFRNIKVEGIVSKTNFTNGTEKVSADIIYSSFLLKNALGTFTIIPQKNNDILFVSNLKIRFGWFFNLFITKKRYKSIVEWRIKKFTENIKNECEKREKTHKLASTIN